jgi:superoxide dismutase, Fe-Mn family
MYTLSKLPYSYNVLEPYIDVQTLKLHHTKHHQGFVDKLNRLLEPYEELQTFSVLDLIRLKIYIPKDIRLAVRNYAGGDACHTFYFQGIGPNEGGKPKGSLAGAIDEVYGSFERFQEKFCTAVTGHYACGWVWLSRVPLGQLLIESTPGNNSPWLFGRIPILAFDVWEHAYYLKYQDRLEDAVAAWWNVVDWDRAEERYHGG